MALLRKIYEWVFYGHLWIALGAAALGWTSQAFALPSTLPPWLIPLFLFLATLGVYTLHRSLSFRRAREARRFRRYRIVYRHPQLSLFLGWGSIAGAALCCRWFPPTSWLTLLLALPFTFFYLIPVWPGGRRLRDFSYLKVFWVALSWTLMTAIFPVVALSLDQYSLADGWRVLTESSFYVIREISIRFFFTLSVAILFDFRDVELDASLAVHTLANRHPQLAKSMVYLFLGGCIIWPLAPPNHPEAGPLTFVISSFPYWASLVVARFTHPTRSEDWYAVVVNGLLVLPGLMLALSGWLD